MKKIAIIPIDNRPICYDLIKDVLSIDKSIKVFMPELKHMGGLTTSADIIHLFEFLENLEPVDYLIVSLDTLAYGGLVPSRRCNLSFGEIKERIDLFKDVVSNKAKKILAFSSVMRISNNNINEEEKEYWSEWGEKIFAWSYNCHKGQQNPNIQIPKEILSDYLKTRKRNFEINKYYLNLASDGFFDTLIFSKDDCAEYGLNVVESLELQEKIDANNLDNVFIKTGADEIPLALITRALTDNKEVKINPVFLNDNSIDLISKYEDISVKNCVLGQISLANCKIQKEADLTLMVNNFTREQGDLVLGGVINSTSGEVIFPKNSYFIADINNANGADKGLINKLLTKKTDNFFGYCGYNTSANTLGCAIFCAVVKYLALKNNTYSDGSFRKFQLIRLLDDWIYQAMIRKHIKGAAPDFEKALRKREDELNLYARKISKFLKYFPKRINYSLPWNRSFEIRIEVTY